MSRRMAGFARVRVVWGLGVAGRCLPCWGGVVVGWQWRSCVSCWGGAVGWRWRDGSGSPARKACNVQCLARHVGAAKWVGGGGVSGQDGGGSRAQMACNVRPGFCVPCWGGAAGWQWRRIGAGTNEGSSRARMACNVQGFACHVRAARRVGSGSVLAVAACWGRDEWRQLACTRRQQWPATFRPLPSPRAREPPEPPPLVPAPTCRPDMARNTTATQDGEHGRGRAGLRPECIRYAIATASSMRVIYNCPALARRPDMTRDTPPPPPQHGSQYHGYARWRTWPRTSWASAQMHKISRRPDMTRDTTPLPPQHGTQHPDHQPATTPPQYGTQHPATANPPCCLNTTHNTPPTRHATSTRHARPSRHRPPRHPDTARNTPPPATDPHTTPTRRATPRHPPPTPTPPRHGAQHPATCRLTATPTQHTPRLHHVAQDPADLPRHLNMARKAATSVAAARSWCFSIL
ncbi:hypothetical protein EDB86DRAFT_2827558 [Lactarius hatsudake]|nr:hypothetical protein EDB86DRAFT_2827558 [Lactarius hatsudake]